MHRNFAEVSGVKTDCSPYFRFCWVAWNKWRSWWNCFTEACLASDYWTGISIDPCYTGVNSLLCSKHCRKHPGLLIHNFLWECGHCYLLPRRRRSATHLLAPNLQYCLQKMISWGHFVPKVQRACSSSCLSLCWGSWIRSAVTWLKDSSYL